MQKTKKYLRLHVQMYFTRPSQNEDEIRVCPYNHSLNIFRFYASDAGENDRKYLLLWACGFLIIRYIPLARMHLAYASYKSNAISIKLGSTHCVVTFFLCCCNQQAIFANAKRFLWKILPEHAYLNRLRHTSLCAREYGFHQEIVRPILKHCWR